jgi:tetratricopeptide (TPR) repeat protein
VKRLAFVALGVGCFVSGVFVHALLAQGRRPAFQVEEIRGQSASEAASTLLDGALQLAEEGSWERIAVGRAWYLGGDKPKGQAIFDLVTSNRRVESSDWFRIGRIYSEAGEWERAAKAFEQALTMKPGDDSGMIEFGALANVNKDRAKAEELFDRAMKKNPREFWHWVNAGGSYLGVRPQ